MNLLSIKKSLLYLGGVILIGVLTNALWEFLFKPSLLTAQNLILNLSTLGVQRFKDSMYIDIASGHHDRASLQLLGNFVGLSAGVLVGAVIGIFALSRSVWRENDALIKRINCLGEPEQEMKPFTKEDAIDETEKIKNRLRKSDRLAFATALIVLVVVAGALTSGIRIAYADSAVAHFEQILSIASPYLVEPRREEFLRSAFSQIRNKDDYEKIILELSAIAQKNGQHVPDFKIW